MNSNNKIRLNKLFEKYKQNYSQRKILFYRMDQSFTSKTLQNGIIFDQFVTKSIRKVMVYIRTVTRKSVKIELPQEIEIAQLKEIIYKKFQIAAQNQVIYLKGICINFNLYIFLENSWIIHVINRDDVKLPQITIEIKTSNLSKKEAPQHKLTINPNITIKQFIEENILQQYSVTLQEILLVQSGRILKQCSTFVEQNIQNGTTITLLHSENTELIRKSLLIKKISQPKDQMYQNNSIQKRQQKLASSQILEESGNLEKPKNTQTKLYQIHGNDEFQKTSLTQSLLTDVSSPCKIFHENKEQLNQKNKMIKIGKRECNCKNQRKEQRKPKFITHEEKKKLSQQIRQQNLHKVMQKKLKKMESFDSLPITERSTLSKVRSLNYLKPLALTERKSLKLVNNPQKATWV